jgi:tetratricopeptide (TPR) repeat protein
MARIEKTVFISYRRTSIAWALAVSQNLTHHGFDVFFDYKGIASGDFDRVILDNIRARAHFLALLTPSALERTADPDDWLRREIETALDTRRNIVPLTLEGFDFSSASIAQHLTGKLAGLRRYNALGVPPDYFDEAMSRLRERYLNVPLESVLHPASATAQQAVKTQQRAVAAAPAVQVSELTAEQWFERGVSATDVDEQVRCYTEAIRLKPDYPYAFNNRGVARKDKGDVEGALNDYTDAIRLKPDFVEAFTNRGLDRNGTGDVEGALKDLNEAIRLKPDYAEAFNNRGIVRSNKGDVEGALNDYDEAIRLKPDFPEAFTNRGVDRNDTGDVEGALKDYNEAIRLKPHVHPLYNRGHLKQRSADFAGAISDFQQYLDLGGGDRHGDRAEIEGLIRELEKKLQFRDRPR